MRPWLWITAHSPSHAGMFERHFLPSFRRFLAPHCDLSVRTIGHACGNFGEEAFNEMGRESVRILAAQVRENLGRRIIVSGCDFRFYAPFMPEVAGALEGHDLAGINDVHGPVCGDFLAFVASEKIAALYDWIGLYDHQFPNEQWTLNAGLRQLGLRVALLPDRFWTFGLQAGIPWEPGLAVNPPRDIALHHANWTIGPANKEALLQAVLDRVEASVL